MSTECFFRNLILENLIDYLMVTSCFISLDCVMMTNSARYLMSLKFGGKSAV